jgi:carboxymethylenebutenolidase
MLNSQFQGYLARPEGEQGPGVLVLHPWWGLNDTIKGVCDRLAKEGFIACAPDLYHGQVAVTIQEAELLSSKLDPEQAKADVAAAVTLLGEPARFLYLLTRALRSTRRSHRRRSAVAR